MAGWKYEAMDRNTGESETGRVDAPEIETAVDRAQSDTDVGFEVYVISRINPPGI